MDFSALTNIINALPAIVDKRIQIGCRCTDYLYMPDFEISRPIMNLNLGINNSQLITSSDMYPMTITLNGGGLALSFALLASTQPGIYLKLVSKYKTRVRIHDTKIKKLILENTVCYVDDTNTLDDFSCVANKTSELWIRNTESFVANKKGIIVSNGSQVYVKAPIKVPMRNMTDSEKKMFPDVNSKNDGKIEDDTKYNKDSSSLLLFGDAFAATAPRPEPKS
jgi:hypothetical protein